MRLFIICLVLLFTTPVFADGIIHSARGDVQVKDGDTLQRNSMWEGLIENLNDVMFVEWNLSRKTPHTQVFKNCTKLTFYKCNLNNVEIPIDSTVIDSLTIHQREYAQDGINYKEIECGDNKTRTYRYSSVDLVEEELIDMGISKEQITPTIKQAIVNTFVEKGKDIILEKGKMDLIDTKDTPNEKSYKNIKRHIR